MMNYLRRLKKNFLDKLSNSTLGIIVYLLIPAIFWCGWLVGDNKDYAEKNKLQELIKLTDTIKHQKDALLFLRMFPNKAAK